MSQDLSQQYRGLSIYKSCCRRFRNECCVCRVSLDVDRAAYPSPFRILGLVMLHPSLDGRAKTSDCPSFVYVKVSYGEELTAAFNAGAG